MSWKPFVVHPASRHRRTRPSRRPCRPSLGALEPRVLLSAADVLTYHNSVTTLPGVNSSETTLTPANVNRASFAKRLFVVRTSAPC